MGRARCARRRAFGLRTFGQAVTLRVEKRGAVGWLIFDQPAKKNAINNDMWRAIPPAMQQFDRDAEVRCVAFRGSGAEAFAAGADISQFEKVRSDAAAVKDYDGLLDRVLHSIQDSPKPSLAMIHGYCLGGGLEIALACDLRYCGASGKFGIPAARLGLGYNIEGHKRLFETVGHARAREIMFLGRRYGAEEALAMGLVHRVLPDAELERYVGEVIQTFCDNAPLAIANSKTILEEYAKATGTPDAERMRSAIERCIKSEDYIEGRRAFMEKRKPRFQGK
jgi:enoyl-CoA hydratase